ncbi:PREDICTED: tax1-binding protein 3 isoform X1 [Myotis brandtii]|uniref:tax1-binding protein 3 isoform X1 n=1 Tax=Myotis brandtii TaxID=109478 RepID=UPI0007041A6D|nr:PREDICTED: tax1-binding protein 3 isoform X1 [Myotis brandtii]
MGPAGQEVGTRVPERSGHGQPQKEALRRTRISEKKCLLGRHWVRWKSPLWGHDLRWVCCQVVWCEVTDKQRVEIHKLRQGENLILGFSIGGGIDQDPSQNPFSEDKTDKGIYVTRVSEGGPAEIAGLQIGDKIMQVNGWDMTMVTHDQARKRLTKRSEEVVRLLVTRQSLQKAVQQSMLS